MNSNTVHYIAAVGQGANALAGLLSAVGAIPHISVSTTAAIIGLLLAFSHLATAMVTPNTNSATPDNLPPKSS